MNVKLWCDFFGFLESRRFEGLYLHECSSKLTWDQESGWFTHFVHFLLIWLQQHLTFPAKDSGASVFRIPVLVSGGCIGYLEDVVPFPLWFFWLMDLGFCQHSHALTNCRSNRLLLLFPHIFSMRRLKPCFPPPVVVLRSCSAPSA